MTPVFDIEQPLELLKNGKAAEAIPILEFISKQMPSHVSAHVLLAQAYVEEERWQEALSSWQNASFLMPNSPSIGKGFREVLNILSRQTIKLIATAPEPVVDQNGSVDAKSNVDANNSDTENSEAVNNEAEESVVEDSTTEESVAENDVAEDSGTEESVAEDSATEESVAEDSATEESVAEDSGTEESVAENDVAEESVAENNVAEESVAEDSTTEESVAEDSATEESVAEDSTTEESVAEDSEVEKTGGYTPKNIFSHSAPPSLPNLASDEVSIGKDLELDDLIHELESARIVPKPEHEIVKTPVLEADIDDMVSETLARIYEGQKQFDEAARVYEKLAVLQPDRASDFEQRASELRARSVNEAD